MGRGWDYSSGDWWILCDSCQRKIKASESRERWDGLRVCADDWETRHPQDFIRARIDKISVPFSRPRPTDTFVEINFTSDNTDNFQFLESITKAVTKVVVNSPVSNGSVINESLGSLTLSVGVLGGSGSTSGFSESVTFSETVIMGRTKVLAETLTISEAVTIRHTFNQSLGTNVLGSVTLG